MCYETVFTMLTTYGNWCYPDEDPLAKRRKTSKADSSKAKEQSSPTTGSNEIPGHKKPLLTVRNLAGDRLSVKKKPKENLPQEGDVFRNVGKEADNPYYIQEYSVTDPALMCGVRYVRNAWPRRGQIPNEPPRYEYRPPTIARPYPLRIRPVFNSFPVQLPHTGWIGASVTSAFTPVRHISADLQTSIVTTQPIMNEHPSSIQSLRQMVCSVKTATSTLSTEELPAHNAFNPVRITSPGSKQSQASKPTAQPIRTAPPSSIQSQELPKFQPSHIPVQTMMYSPSSSLQTEDQTTCSVTISSPEDLSVKRAFSSSGIISTGSSTSQTPIVTTQPVRVGHSPFIQSPCSMVGSVTAATSTLPAEEVSANSALNLSIAQPVTTTPLSSPQSPELPTFQPSHVPVQTIMFSPSSSLQTANQSSCSVTTTATTLSAEDLSVNSSAFSTARMTSPKSEVSKPQELTNFQPSHIPVQTIMYSPSSSVRAANQSVCSVSTTTSAGVTTSSDEEHSVSNAVNTVRIKSSESAVPQTSIVTTQPVMTRHSSSTQAQESPRFQTSHIPVQAITYKPLSSLRAANRSLCSTTNTNTTSSSAEQLPADNELTRTRTISSGSSKSQVFKPTAQPNTTTSSPSVQPQESPKFQPSHIPVQTIMYSPLSSLQAADQTTCSVTTAVTSSLPEDLSVSRATSTAKIISTESSTTQTSIVTSQQVTAAHSYSIQSPSLMAGSVVTTTSTSSAEELCVTSNQIMSSGLSQSEDSELTAQPITATLPSSLQPQELPKVQSSQIASEGNAISSQPSLQPEESSKTQTSVPSTQSITTVPLSSLQPPVSSNSQTSKLTTHLLLLSPSPSGRKSSEPSTSQTSKPTTQPIAPSSSLQSSESTTTQTPKITTHLLLLSPPASIQSSEPSTSQTAKPTNQPINVGSSSSLQSSESPTTQTPKLTTHLLLLSPPHSIQSSELSTSQVSKSTTQPITVASSSSLQPSESKTTQASKLTTHLLVLSPPQSLQSSESSKSQNPTLTKLLLISPPISQKVCTATTPTTTSPAVVSSGTRGESSNEVAFDLDEAVIQSVVGAIKVDIPDTNKTTIRRKEDEIEEKDALLQRMYSVPAFGGKTVKGAGFFEEMLTKQKLCHLFKCMASECSFTCNQKTLFDQHIKLHEEKREPQKEPSKDPSEEDDELCDWQQCAYCCESPTYPTTSLSEHIVTEHGYCVYQCAYCFYRALFQNYVDIHQTLAHRKILKTSPRVIYKCKAFSDGPTVANALKKTGRRRCVRPYHCDQCGSEFLITEEFMNHLLKEHQSVTSYTCHICKNVCFKPDRLVVHYKLHSYSTYQCAYCLHGTETERKMIFHLCTFHFAQPACLYVRAWENGKQVQSEDKSKKLKNKTKSTNQLDCLKMISYDIEATRGECTIEDASDEDSMDDRLVIDESQELNDIIAELGITTETEPSQVTTPLIQELASIGNSTSQTVSVSTLLPNAKFSLECETGGETVLISSGSSSNSSSN